MYVKVPEVNTCCFCIPLQWGIIVFGYINIIFSLLAIVCLVVTIELKKLTITNGSSLEMATSTVLFGVFGMGVILNALLVVAGYQKDIMMLRLYNVYAVITILAALVPTTLLLTRMLIFDAFAAFSAIVTQCYVIVVVRSEVVKLEQKLLDGDEECEASSEEVIAIPDGETLI